MNKIIISIASVFLLAASAYADTHTPRVEKRERNQEARIQQGVESGALTEKETARLEKGQEHVDKLEDKAAADGKVTAKERARLHHAQDVESRRIERQKHDRQRDTNHDGINDQKQH